MCTVVRVEQIDPSQPQWRRDDVAIIVSDELTTGQRLIQIRALLEFLGAPQRQCGATCWCGEPVTVPALTVRAQKTLAAASFLRARVTVEA